MVFSYQLPSDEAVLVGVSGGRSAGRNPELREGVLQMPPHGVLAEDKLGGDYAVALPGRNEA